MHYLLILENSKIYIKICVKIAPTFFGPRSSSSRSLHLSLAKFTFTSMLKQSVKLSRYVRILCGGVAACCIMLPHHRITHKDVVLPIVLT
jgi:hypothetical protein